MKPSFYEPHPVSPERKAELMGQGFKIMDARFAPEGWEAPDTTAPEEPGPDLSRTGIARMTRSEVEEALSAHGVAQDEMDGHNADELRDKLRDLVFVDL